jgi:hypothetical protein
MLIPVLGDFHHSQGRRDERLVCSVVRLFTGCTHRVGHVNASKIYWL